jgi:hypothetical protein
MDNTVHIPNIGVKKKSSHFVWFNSAVGGREPRERRIVVSGKARRGDRSSAYEALIDRGGI